MGRDLYSKCVWMVDTIKRRGRITRRELGERWQASPVSEGQPLCRRTFYNYRNAISELFHITIDYDPKTFEYFISDVNEHDRSVTDWLLNTQAVNDVLNGARDISDRIFVDDIPSAREFLGVVIDAIRQGRRIIFDYHNYARSRPTHGVAYEPYFLKLFRQRWYVVGRAVADNKIKTYALDRMSKVRQADQTFRMPAGFDPAEYFRDAFGIVVTQNEPRRIALRADHRNANYLRDLPLHHSQEEVVHDGFSIFYYRMRLTQDLLTEILSYGSRIAVLEPPELKAMVATELRNALQHYNPSNTEPPKEE